MLLCCVPECERKAVRKGYCNTHFHQIRRNGKIGYKNPNSMIGRYKRSERIRAVDHPLYYSWKFMRHKHKGQVVEEWDTFEKFIADIPPKPTERAFCQRRDNSLPWGPDNFLWREPMFEESFDFNSSEQRAAYSRKYRKHLDYDRVRHYREEYGGFTVEEYDKLYAEQEGKCFICGQFREVLSVDHCHDTMVVRGLLDGSCNTGLGCFKHSIPNLSRAIYYLARHEESPIKALQGAIDHLQSILEKERSDG